MYMTCNYSLLITAMTEWQQPGLDRVKCTARPLCQAAETVFHWYWLAILQLDICTADINYLLWARIIYCCRIQSLAETSLRSGEGLPSAEMLSCCCLYRACARLRIMTSYVVYASVTLVYWPDAAASFHSPIELSIDQLNVHRFPVQLASISSSALWKEGRHISSHHCIHPFEREPRWLYPPWFSINVRSLRSTKDKRFWRGCCGNISCERNPWQHTSWIELKWLQGARTYCSWGRGRK